MPSHQKSSAEVSEIGIDIGKTTFHFIRQHQLMPSDSISAVRWSCAHGCLDRSSCSGSLMSRVA